MRLILKWIRGVSESKRGEPIRVGHAYTDGGTDGWDARTVAFPPGSP